jgi:hypothetical protein
LLLSLLFGQVSENGLPFALLDELVLFLEEFVGALSPLGQLLVVHIVLSKHLVVGLFGGQGDWLEAHLEKKSVEISLKYFIYKLRQHDKNVAEEISLDEGCLTSL